MTKDMPRGLGRFLSAAAARRAAPRLLFMLWLSAAGTGGCKRAAEPRAPAREPSQRVTLEGDSLSYVHSEPAGTPAATAERPLFAHVSLDERRVAVLGAPVSGRVTEVHVVTGAAVQKGTPLLTIHSQDVAAARSQLAQAREARMLAAQQAARASLLVKQGAGSEAEREEAETALASARTEEERAKAAMGALGGVGSVSDYVLRAPVSGMVVERNVDVGNAVGADQGLPLITIADLSTVWVLADVYENDLPYIHEGQSARVVVPALDGRRYMGKVTYVGDVLDAVTRTARARVELENQDGALRAGMFAEMMVEAPEPATAIVPTRAILARRDETFVFVETAKGHFEARKVTTGTQVGDHVALLGGVKAGERVVTRGAILLDAEANAAF